MIWLPFIWLVSKLPSCILPIMKTYRTITTKITKADKSTDHPHRDNTNSKTQKLQTGDRIMTFNNNIFKTSHIEKLVIHK